MSSREAILNRVKTNKPAAVALPQTLAFPPVPADACIEKFARTVEAVGGTVVEVTNLAEIGAYLKKHYESPERVLNTVHGVGFGQELSGPIEDGHVLANLEIAVVTGSVGVAENGAVWVSEENLPTRVLPFITEHLMLVVAAENIVSNMHEAYVRLDVSAPGFGAFISGPSRTADIEQSLVIGAHGPKRAHVFILK
ncbi:LutC/YkgG family protein [Botryobacter ruber]|uniref:LutC/YkgG family protein n=1 Tax=Botryobacter ruber TaxID=2171629 RepID=UPI000E0C44CB|nr:LUD domain-containing protein [Botryobacter ruber]